jgi:hypothetical protein
MHRGGDGRGESPAYFGDEPAAGTAQVTEGLGDLAPHGRATTTSERPRANSQRTRQTTSPQLQRPRYSAHRTDDADQLLKSVAVSAGEPNKLTGVLYHFALLRRSGDGNAAATAELQQAFFAKFAEGAQDGVGVDAEDGREVARGREPLSLFGFTVCDRAADLRGDLDVEVDGFVTVDLDAQHDATYISSMLVTA